MKREGRQGSHAIALGSISHINRKMSVQRSWHFIHIFITFFLGICVSVFSNGSEAIHIFHS